MLLLGVGFILLITAFVFKSGIVDILLKFPQYAKKYSHKHFKIEDNSIELYSEILPTRSTQWVIRENVIKVANIPDPRWPKRPIFIPYNKLQRIAIEKQSHWKHGTFYELRIWHEYSEVRLICPKYRWPDYAISFRSFALQTIQEIERQVNEHNANKEWVPLALCEKQVKKDRRPFPSYKYGAGK